MSRLVSWRKEQWVFPQDLNENTMSNISAGVPPSPERLLNLAIRAATGILAIHSALLLGSICKLMLQQYPRTIRIVSNSIMAFARGTVFLVTNSEPLTKINLFLSVTLGWNSSLKITF